MADRRLEDLFVRFLQQPGLRQSLAHELALLHRQQWSPASATAAVVPPPPPRRRRDSQPLAEEPPPRRGSLADVAARGRRRSASGGPGPVGHDALPPFYYPPGARPRSAEDEQLLQQVRAALEEDQLAVLRVDDFELVAKACGLPSYLATDLYRACGGKGAKGVSSSAFIQYWTSLTDSCPSLEAKVLRILNPSGQAHLQPLHFHRMIRYLIQAHPGLEFLKDTPQYHDKYRDTVVARIFYSVNRSWSGKITASELQRSNFLQVLQSLEDEPNINKEPHYFSYEHFYVIYASFCRLDLDQDGLLDKADLTRHGDCGLSDLVLDRIFANTVFQQPAADGKMSYWDFVVFILSEEDKSTPTALEYWFRILDLDGDGVVSMFELEQFYNQQLHRLKQMNVESLPFADCLCEVLDQVRPQDGLAIRLRDLKKTPQAKVIINIFVNLTKYLDFEEQEQAKQPDQPIDEEENKLTDWQQFAQREYLFIAAEEDEEALEAEEEEAEEAAAAANGVLATRKAAAMSPRPVRPY